MFLAYVRRGIVWPVTALALMAIAACSQASSVSQPASLLVQDNLQGPEVAGAHPSMAVGVVVANFQGESVSTFAFHASGNTPPLTSINGTNTGLDNPVGVSVSGTNYYVTNSSNNTVLVFPSTANGNVAPSATISCGGLDQPRFEAFDKHGNLFVANLGNNTISVFRPGASGCVSGNRIIGGTKTGLDQPAGMLISNGTLFVSNFVGNTITEYLAGASGNVKPKAAIAGGSTTLSGPYGLATDGSGLLFVANNHGHSILVFAKGVSGNVAPQQNVSGGFTGLNYPSGIAVYNQKMYVTDDLADNRIYVFASNANGDVSPLRTIEGPATGLDFPVGLAI
jgi:hypothetical protein